MFVNHTRRCRHDNGPVVWFVAKLKAKILVKLAQALRLGVGQGCAHVAE